MVRRPKPENGHRNERLNRLTEKRSSHTLGGMCQAKTCPKCKKPTWAGCGNHVEQVLGGVPKAQRCHCREDQAAAKAASGANKASGTATGERVGLMARLRGR